jgi:hypothetical protein
LPNPDDRKDSILIIKRNCTYKTVPLFLRDGFIISLIIFYYLAKSTVGLIAPAIEAYNAGPKQAGIPLVKNGAGPMGS